MSRLSSAIALVLLAATAPVAFGQTTQPSQVASVAPPAPYTPVRYNEDYRALAKTPGKDLYDPIKYVPLGPAGWYASFGGQARVRYEGWSNENFGAVQNDWGYGLQRYLLHADLHFGDNFRVFAQGKTSLVDDGRTTPITPRATDADQVDVQQLFADVKLPLGDKASTTFRFGRQDLIYGAQRLISPLDWTNVRRTFEGAKLSTQLGGPTDNVSQTLDAFLVRPVIVDNQELNDGNGNVAFGGVYDTIGLPNVFKGGGTKLDVYALGLWTSSPLLDSDVYTLGTRFFTNPKPFDLDVELDYQFGKTNALDVSAYSIAAEAGYTFVDASLTPRVYAGFDYASGDGNPTDGASNTFNQLFPLGHAYFGYIDVVGRQNIIDAHPGVELTLLQNQKYAKKVSLRSDFHVFWRAENTDALYSAAGAALRPGAAGSSSFVGTELDLLLSWQVDRHLQFYTGYSHFFPGQSIDDTGPANDDIDFVYAALTYTF